MNDPQKEAREIAERHGIKAYEPPTETGCECPRKALPHETRPVQVWVDADLGIADMVEYLNTIPGIRTQASCQGTVGEGGPHPYRAQVLCTWTLEALVRLQSEFDVVPEGNLSWGYVHPKLPELSANATYESTTETKPEPACECRVRKALEVQPCRCSKATDANYNCPQCGRGLHPVRYQGDSILNREQFDAVRAGDYYCESCKGDEARSGFRYFWESELPLKIQKCARCAALSDPCSCEQLREEYDRLGLSYVVLEGQYECAVQIIREERSERDRLKAECEQLRGEVKTLRHGIGTR